MGRYKVDLCGVSTSSLPVLKNDEMNKLFVQLKDGDVSCKETLILGNLKLVLAMTQRFAHRVDNMDDLFQIGCVGLIKAIDNFDLSHEVRFSTYAVPMILGEMKRYLRDNQMIRVSRQLKELAYRVLKEKEKYMHTHQKEPTIEEMARLVNASEKDVQESLESIQSVVSIFEPIYNDESDTLYLLDQIQDSHDEIELLKNRLSVQESLKHLNEKEYDIIHQRYYDGKTQVEIASELGISQAQVSRLEKNALKTMVTSLIKSPDTGLSLQAAPD